MIFFHSVGDPREKENDLARAGFVHTVTLRGTEEECRESEKWCRNNLLGRVLFTRGSSSYSNGWTDHFRTINLTNENDVILVKLRWA